MRPKLLLTALAASALLAACGGSKSSSSTSSGSSGATGSTTSSAAVKPASNAQLKQTILVNSQGMTLYHLSGETSTKFICTSSCVAVWHPVGVSAGATPSGVKSLTVVKRPEGGRQLAYNGMPLYTFSQDKAAGEANGQGFKDVGTWMAVPVSGSSAQGSSSSSSSGSSSSGESNGAVGY
ncbi:MAG: COG4315 family predicted lipoprotein [Solirubrobacteraceae bacterium]